MHASDRLLHIDSPLLSHIQVLSYTVGCGPCKWYNRARFFHQYSTMIGYSKFRAIPIFFFVLIFLKSSIFFADDGSTNVQATLELIRERAHQTMNHSIAYETWTVVEKGEHPTRMKVKRTIFGDMIRQEWEGTWSGDPIRYAHAVSNGKINRSWNSIPSSNGNRFLGRISSSPAEGYISMLKSGQLAPWLLGIADGDSAFVWDLMRAHMDRVVQHSKDHGQYVELSADLPSGKYALQIEKDKGYRIRMFSFDKQLPGGGWTKGKFEVESFSRHGDLYFPATGRFTHQFRYRHMSSKKTDSWHVRVDKFDILNQIPSLKAFNMNWPYLCMIRDSVTSGNAENKYVSDNFGNIVPLESAASVFPNEKKVAEALQIEKMEKDVKSQQKSHLGQPPPDIKAERWLNSDPVAWSALRGKLVVVHFFSEGCGACKGTYPLLVDLHQKYAGKRLVILGVHQRGSKEADIKRLVEKYRLYFPIAIDEPTKGGSAWGETFAAYGVFGIPDTFLVDENGILVRHGHISEIIKEAESKINN